jgi:transcriptional regulator with XRE-family HTH domain
MTNSTRIEEIRRGMGLNQVQLAEKLNLSKQVISNYETGVREPGVGVLLRMADTFGISVDYLLGRSDSEEKLMRRTAIASLMVKELKKADSLYGPNFASAHEGYAILREELDELWEEIKKKSPDQNRLREEAIQVGAMAMKFIFSINKWSQPELEKE